MYLSKIDTWYFCFIITPKTQGNWKYIFHAHKKRGMLFLKFTCMSIHLMKFSSFSSGTTNKKFMKFRTRIYMSILYCVMHFQIYCSSTSCSQKTWPGTTILMGTPNKSFLKFVIRIYVTELHYMYCKLFVCLCFQMCELLVIGLVYSAIYLKGH